MTNYHRQGWVRLLAGRGLSPARIAFVLDVDESVVVADLARPYRRRPRIRAISIAELKALRAQGWTTYALAKHFGISQSSAYRLLMPASGQGPPTPSGPPKSRKNSPILGQMATRVKRLKTLGFDAAWIATTLELDPAVVADFLSRIEPVRTAELVRPREPRWEKQFRANQAAKAEREERRRLLTPPAGWTENDRFRTGEATEWIGFMTALQEARATGADILGFASRLFFAPPRPLREAPPVESDIWTGPENPNVGNPKLTPEMLAEIHVLRAQGWSTGKLAKRYDVTRATICYALLGRTFRELKLPPPPPFVADPLARPSPATPTHAASAPRNVPAPAPATSAGWSDADRLATGEGRDWSLFLSTAAEARASDVDGQVAPSRMSSAAPPVEPAMWTGPTDDDLEAMSEDAPEDMSEVITAVKVLRAITRKTIFGWPTLHRPSRRKFPS
jgi:transposase